MESAEREWVQLTGSIMERAFGKLYILIGIGDCREPVYIQDLDKGPSCAARDVYLLWRTTPSVNEEIECED